jgi:ATP-dependent Clp protease adapter protein ClpS
LVDSLARPTQTNRPKLLRIIVLLVDEVHPIEYLLRLVQAMFSLDASALLSIELAPHPVV